MLHTIFGLGLECDVPLPELPRGGRGAPALRAVLRSRASTSRGWRWIDQWDGETGRVWLRIARRGPAHLLRFPALADFIVTDSTVTCRPARAVPLGTLRHLLIDQVVPLALSARGHVLLHASAVTTRGGAILFVGPSGSGKSTLAFALAGDRRGFVSDDVVRIRTGRGKLPVVAIPAYPGARLWPDVLDAFRGIRGRAVAHYSSKRRIAAPTPAAGRARRVARIYLLQEAPQIAIEPITPRAALLELLRHTYRIDADDASTERRQFEALASMCASVSVRTLAYPRDLATLHLVVRAVRRDSGRRQAIARSHDDRRPN